MKVSIGLLLIMLAMFFAVLSLQGEAAPRAGFSSSAPTVVSTDPANGALHVGTTAPVSATFSKEMDPSSINVSTFLLHGAVTDPVGVVSYNSATKSATFTLSVGLAASTIYTARITTGVRDLVGNHMASDYIWSFTTESEVDSIPPASVDTLTSSNRTSNSITLVWTAPGDDGSTGTAASYDIRYSTFPITDANWDACTKAIGEPIPRPAGSSESFTVTGLDPGTNYYFALRTEDEAHNWSDLSNVASRSTLLQGDINRDGKVSLADLATLAAAYGSRPGDTNWNPNADLNNDGKVSLTDLAILAQDYGKSV